jgi:hypothetical protein
MRTLNVSPDGCMIQLIPSSTTKSLAFTFNPACILSHLHNTAILLESPILQVIELTATFETFLLTTSTLVTTQNNA